MKQALRIFTLLAVGFLAAGCGGVRAIDPANPVTVGDGISVSPQIAWNQFSGNGQIIWTQNGPALDALRFITGVKAGNPLYSQPGPREDRVLFNPTMLPNDLQDLVVTVMGRDGFMNVRSTGLAPCPFGKDTGFCFDLSFANQDGLQMKGKVIVDKRADRLEVFEFHAPAEYYFDELSPSIGRIFGSIQVK